MAHITFHYFLLLNIVSPCHQVCLRVLVYFATRSHNIKNKAATNNNIKLLSLTSVKICEIGAKKFIELVANRCSGTQAMLLLLWTDTITKGHKSYNSLRLLAKQLPGD